MALVYLEVIKKLEENKATGPDDISIRLVKETADEIAHSLCHLFKGQMTNDHKFLDKN